MIILKVVGILSLFVFGSLYLISLIGVGVSTGLKNYFDKFQNNRNYGEKNDS